MKPASKFKIYSKGKKTNAPTYRTCTYHVSNPMDGFCWHSRLPKSVKALWGTLYVLLCHFFENGRERVSKAKARERLTGHKIAKNELPSRPRLDKWVKDMEEKGQVNDMTIRAWKSGRRHSHFSPSSLFGLNADFYSSESQLSAFNVRSQTLPVYTR